MRTPLAPADRVAITGIGLVTSLGLDAQSSLSAIRSGLANFSEHETVLIECEEYGTELCGVTIARLPQSALSRDLHGTNRAVALLSRAVRECVADVPKQLLKNAVWRLSAGSMPEQRDFIPLLVAALPDIHIHPFLENNDLQTSRSLFFENIIQAAEQLKKQTTDICFVGCVDSLCDTPVLEELLDADRLKNRMANPEGIVAGEAAGVFALELEEAALSRGARILGYINAWGRSVEPSPCNSGKTDFSGTGLQDCLKAALSSLEGSNEEISCVIADLNGEAFRAREWAFAATAFAGKKKPDLMHPADCTGDCGSAMGAVLLSAALDVLSEAHPPTTVLVYTSDEGPERRALCLQAAEPRAAVTDAPKREGRVATVPEVIAQHWEVASFLWSNRPRIAKSATHFLEDLRQNDRRLLANLKGLSHAAAAEWNIWEHWPAFPEASDFFAAAFLAFTSSNEEAIQSLLNKADADTDLLQGIGSALGWLPWAAAKPHIDSLFIADSPYHRFVAVTASTLHRHDPGYLLNRAAYDPCPQLKARALRAMGELGRRGTLNLVHLSHSYKAEDNAARFWASWSGTLAGDPDALPALVEFITPDSPFRHRAVNVAFRRMDAQTALRTWEGLARQSSTRRLAITAAGVIGDPALVPWILEQMALPELARISGGVFTIITGADLAVIGTEETAPEQIALGRCYDLLRDPDEGLPWPNVKLVSAWWDENKKKYPEGIRHFLGEPITRPHLLNLLKTGRQLHRAAAALHLAMMTPGRQLFDVGASASLQIEELFK